MRFSWSFALLALGVAAPVAAQQAAVSPALLAIGLRVRSRERKWVKYVKQLRSRAREADARAAEWEARAKQLEEWNAGLPPRYQLGSARPRSGSFRSLPSSKPRRALPPARQDDDEDEREELS